MEKLTICRIKDVLLDRNDIEDILYFGSNKFFNTEFEFLQQCKLVVDDKKIPIIIGIPKDWEINLFSFYIVGYGYSCKIGNLADKIGYNDCCSFRHFIPHVGPGTGKLCLIDSEEILIDPQFEGLFNQCIDKAKSIIKQGIEGTDKGDFIKEFSSYWGALKYSIEARLVRPVDKEVALLKCTEIKKENADNLQVKIAAENTESVYFWSQKGTLYNAAYLQIRLTEPVFPPDPRNPLNVDFLNKLINCIPYNNFKMFQHKFKFPFDIFFRLINPIPDSTEVVDICLGIRLIEGRIEQADNKFRCSAETKIIPVNVSVIDKDYLMQRTNMAINPLKDLNFLVVGCGSIGGYLTDLLVKAGCEKITLVDPDDLTEINIFRHLLGRAYIHDSKVSGLKKFVSCNIPNVSITPIKSKLQEAVEKGSIMLDKFNYIFSVTGNQNVNRWLEKVLNEKTIKTRVIYGWNEPLDIGCHAAFVDMNKPGRISSILEHSADGGLLYDVTAYTAPNQKITINNSGCGSSFVPYGTDVSIRTALHCMDLLKRSEGGELSNNIIISEKGPGTYFNKSGLKVSKIYEKQTEVFTEKVL